MKIIDKSKKDKNKGITKPKKKRTKSVLSGDDNQNVGPKKKIKVKYKRKWKKRR